MSNTFFQLYNDPVTKINYYIIPKNTLLYRGDSNPTFNPQELPDKPLFFGLNKDDVEQYGIVYRYKTKKDMKLLSLDRENNTFYKNTPSNIKTILNEQYGFNDELRKRNSDNSKDKSLVKYICDRGYDGYANDEMNHIDPGRGNFHKEIVICNINNIEYNGKEEITKEREELKRYDYLLQKVGNPGKKRRPITSYDEEEHKSPTKRNSIPAPLIFPTFNTPPSSPRQSPTRQLFGGKKKSRKSKKRKSKRKTRSRKQNGGDRVYSYIVQAIEMHDSVRLENLLQHLLFRGVAPEYVNMDNGSIEGPPLVRASAYGNSARDIKNLLNAGADVNGKNNEDYNSLMYASYNGNIDVVKILLDAGADVNAKNKDGDTALTLTTELLRNPEKRNEIISTLLNRGADVDAKDNMNNTALIIATRRGYKDLVKILLDAGADVNVQTNDNETPLILANDFEYPEIVELIKNHIKEIKHKNLRTARLVTTMGKSKKNGSPLMIQGQRDGATLIAEHLHPKSNVKGGYYKKRTRKNRNNKLR